MLLLLYGINFHAYGQVNQPPNQPRDTSTVQNDTTHARLNLSNFEIHGIRLGGSASGAVQTLFFPGRQKIGAHIDVGIGRYIAVGEVGFHRIKRTDKSFDTNTDFTYINNGLYYRFGVDVNFLKTPDGDRFDPDGNAIFFGFRYAGSQFGDKINYRQTDPLFGTQTLEFSNSTASANWLELTTGIKIKVLPYVFLGYNVLYKFRRKLRSPENLESYDIPGFGRGNVENTVGFEYYILFHLPFRK